jgi:isoleucyl-tRNA synthetase
MSADYKSTINLPQTEFPMKAGLPKREPELLAEWQKGDLYGQLRDASKDREKFILHDGPPYANGHLHIGHALNKILKDVINRSQQMLGKDSIYVPGWDCHGLPIEWMIEEKYRKKGKNKDDIPINEFRQECRVFAQEWIDVQREEFKRLGVLGDWDNPYTTMTYAAEAQIVRELGKFLMNGSLYRGSKPVMWSVVEKTALAEAEVEYHDHESDQVWVKFPLAEVLADSKSESDDLFKAFVVIWTTTPWTIPGNRAISFSNRIKYGLYEIEEAPEDNWAKAGEKYILADTLAGEVFKQARVESFKRVRDVSPNLLTCYHPLKELGYNFKVPLLAGSHVTDDTGTGFVHTAPGHGVDDFEIWVEHKIFLDEREIDSAIPYTVDGDGFFTDQAPGFEDGTQVITDKGKKGNANEAVIAALREANNIIARARLKHQYPHSWRSKKPVIFRNTPQWFIAMDTDLGDGSTLRQRVLGEIEKTRWVPAQGKNRIGGMVQDRPDWVISRQRAWGVPITVFVDKKTGEPLRDQKVLDRIAEAVEKEGTDVWFSADASQFLEPDYNADDFDQVTDILDVWFDSGSTHSFVLEDRPELSSPADLYLEGSDQHRGWFHSSLLESCGTRGCAPYKAVLTHGFVMAEDGQKMSKSLGNVVAPQDVIKQSGADILRLWVVGSDYSEDLRIGSDILKQHADVYRRLRNTMRYLRGNLNNFSDEERLDVAEMPELERWVLHRLYELDGRLKQTCDDYNFHAFFSELHTFCAVELSAFYFDVRKDCLYCDPVGSAPRRAARTVLDILFDHLTAWLAPFICFTADEAWHARHGDDVASVHMRSFPDVPTTWQNDDLAARWQKIMTMRRVVTKALETERAAKNIGSSLEAHPVVYVGAEYEKILDGIDVADVCITSGITVTVGDVPSGAAILEDVADIGVVFARAAGDKCVRCWKVLEDVGQDSEHTGVCSRCADAVRQASTSV